jgi:hypothetical protein
MVQTPMRALRAVVFLAVVEGMACQRGPGMCPEGMTPDRARDGDAKSVWCKGKEANVRRWIELWSPAERRQSCGFRDGRPEGPFLAWHEGGNKWIEGQYRDGEKVGKWTQWDKQGRPVAEGEYRDGRLIAGAPVGMVALCEKQKP